MNNAKYIFTTLLLVFMLSCSTDDTQQVKVFKSDGSLQCGTPGVDVDVMVMELINAGIDVICSQKGSDGSPHLAACGIETGDINIYTIDTSNLPDAEALGFESVNTLPDYQDEQCQ